MRIPNNFAFFIVISFCSLSVDAIELLKNGLKTVNQAVNVVSKTVSFTLEEFELFMDWNAKFQKTYSSREEREQAILNLSNNKKAIDYHNSLFQQGLTKYTRALSIFSDMSPEQKDERLNGLTAPSSFETTTTRRPQGTTTKAPVVANAPPAPKSVDWRKKGLIGPVEYQGLCGSCWAYAAKGVIEANLRKRKKEKNLAPQQLLDCSKSGCFSCSGGWPVYALDYIKENGITEEDDYPYVGENKECDYHRDMSVEDKVINQTFFIWTNGNETWLRDIVALRPVVVVMRMQPSFYEYEAGVYSEPDCPKDINHAMLCVGYGTDPSGGDFWLIRNSFGEDWGEQGYIRVARNKDNMCGIAHSAVYAT